MLRQLTPLVDPMLVHVTSAYGDSEPIDSLLAYAALDKVGQFVLTDSPEFADIILFAENSRYHQDYFYQGLKQHWLVKQYPEKVFMYNPHDKPWLVLPGLYASMPRTFFNADLMAASPYVEQINPYIRYDRAVSPTYLFSFIGSPNSGPRRQILKLNEHPRALVKPSLADMFGTDNLTSAKESYAEVLSQSKFVLCPRGAGTSSFRLFETMQAGRVPVIISDYWVAPKGPCWDDFALFVPECDVGRLPEILAAAEAQWAERATLSRKAWETFFAPDVIFNYLMESISALKKKHNEVSFSTTTLQQIPYLKYAFRALVIQKVKGRIRSVKK